jgi:predicted glycosyltransferase
VCMIRQQGTLDDLPHRLARDAASWLLAPWPLWLDADDPLRHRTLYAGCFSRFDGRGRPAPARSERRRLVVLVGAGGTTLRTTLLAAWARRLGTAWSVHVVGTPIDDGGDDETGGGQLTLHGWLDDPWGLLASADVVASHAGHNAVSEVAAAGRPLIAIAEERPFAEQLDKIRCLRASGTGLTFEGWPGPAECRDAVVTALADPPRTADLADGRGAERAARYIEAMVEGASARRGRINANPAPAALRPSATASPKAGDLRAPSRSSRAS